MILNLTLRKPDLNPLITNVSTKEIEGCKKVDSFTNLEAVVDYGQPNRIIAESVIDFVPFNDAKAHLEHWSDLLAYKGILHLDTLDIFAIAKAGMSGGMGTSEMCERIYGDNRLCFHSTKELKLLLKECGLTVTSMTNSIYWTSIKAEKN